MISPSDQAPPIYLPTEEDYRRLIHFTRRWVQPYPAVYVTQDDILLVKVWSPGVSSTVNISLRVQLPDGQVTPAFYSYNISTLGSTPAQQVIEQVEGFLLSATVETPNAPAGQCYVQLQIVRGRGTGDQTAGQLLTAGYPGQGFAIGYPQTLAGSPTAGPGQTVTVNVANPAAGADWSYVTPAGTSIVLQSVRAVLTTSVAVANRVPDLRILAPSAQIIGDFNSPSNQAASLVYTYTWAAATQTVATPPTVVIGLPTGLRLAPGSTVQTITAGIQAADTWTSITLTYQQFVSS